MIVEYNVSNHEFMLETQAFLVQIPGITSLNMLTTK